MSSEPESTTSGPSASPQKTDTDTTPTLPKAKISAFTRFASYTTSALPALPFTGSKASEAPFPPQSWDLSSSPQSGTGASDWEQKAEQYKEDLERWRQEVGQAKDTPTEEASASSGGQQDPAETVEPDTDTDTRTLAMKIKSLIDEKFSFGSAAANGNNAPSTPGDTTPTPRTGTAAAGTSGSSTPSADKANTTTMFSGIDATLAKLLSSESIMNGQVGKGLENTRESVWSMLDKLGSIAGASGTTAGPSKNGNSFPAEGEVEQDGIMMCTPLQPTNELPEIADSEIEYSEEPQPPAQGQGQTPSSQTQKQPKPAKPKRTFYPSATALSLEVTWWGYRLFLPPPVIEQLSSAHVAAARRGAMITAALKWLLDQIPLMVVPPQLRASVLMMKRVSPYLGYVGAFVAWSWGRVQAKDEGKGVVLISTWLLPIAIVPTSWDYEVHGRPRTDSNATVSKPVQRPAEKANVTEDAKPEVEKRNGPTEAERPSVSASTSESTTKAPAEEQTDPAADSTPAVQVTPPSRSQSTETPSASTAPPPQRKPSLLSSASRRLKSFRRSSSMKGKEKAASE